MNVIFNPIVTNLRDVFLFKDNRRAPIKYINHLCNTNGITFEVHYCDDKSIDHFECKME